MSEHCEFPVPGQGLQDKLDGAVARYSELSAFRATVAFIPYVGSAIDAIVSGRGQKIVAARTQRVIDELQRQARHLDERKLDRTFLESEEFFDLLCRVLQNSQQTGDLQKVALFVRVLLCRAEAPSHSENAEEYIRLLADLSLVEIRVAAAIFSEQRDWKARDGSGRRADTDATQPEQLVPRLPELTPPRIAAYLQRLERHALVRELADAYVSYEGDSFYVTDYFRDLMAFLDLHDLADAPE